MNQRAYACGIGPVFEVIGGKWRAAILWELNDGSVRFGELKRRVAGISEKMLIQHLRDLERDHLVTRKVFHQVPPRVEYSVTDWGADLNRALSATADWGERYAKAMGRYDSIE